MFTLRERTCNNKYYVRYDGKRGGPPVKLENSYFKIINTQIDLNKEAYVEVIYKDIKSGFDKLFHSFGKENDLSCDLSEFIVEENV